MRNVAYIENMPGTSEGQSYRLLPDCKIKNYEEAWHDVAAEAGGFL